MPLFSRPSREDEFCSIFASKVKAWSKIHRRRLIANGFRYVPLAQAVHRITKFGVTQDDALVVISQLVSVLFDIVGKDDSDILRWISEKVTAMKERIIIKLVEIGGHFAAEAQEREEQSAPSVASMVSFIGMVLSFICSVFLPRIDVAKRVVTAVANMTRVHSSLDSVMQGLKENFSFLAPKEGEKLELLKDLSQQADDYIRGTLTERYHGYKKALKLDAKMREELPEAAALFKGNPRGERVTNLFMATNNRLQKSIENVSPIVKELAKVRPVPVCRHIYGPPGHGKTHMIEKDWIPRILSKMNITTSDPIWNLSPILKYVPPYLDQPFALLDEFLALREEDTRIPSFNALASGGPVQMDGAGVEEKYQTPRFRVMFTLANVETFNPPQNIPVVGMKDSLNSRLNGIYAHWTGFTSGKSRGEQGERKLCFHKHTSDDRTWQTLIDSGRTTCPDDSEPISDEIIIDDIVAEWKRNDLDYQRDMAARVRSIESGHAARVPTFTIHGKTNTGKTTLVADLCDELMKRGYTVGSGPADDITISDDILPEDEKEFCETYDRKQKGVMIAIGNISTNRGKLRRRTKVDLHSRTLSRLSIKGQLTSSDDVSLESTNPGMEIRMDKLGVMIDGATGKKISQDTIVNAITRLCGSPGKQRDMMRSDYIPPNPTATVSFNDFGTLSKYTVSGAGRFVRETTGDSRKRLTRLLRYYEKHATKDIYPILKTIRDTICSVDPDAIIMIHCIRPDVTFVLQDARWTYVTPCDTGPWCTQYRENPDLLDPLSRTIARIETGDETESVASAAQNFISSAWDSFFSLDFGKASLRFIWTLTAAIASSLAVSIITKKTALRSVPKTKEPTSSSKWTGSPIERIQTLIRDEPDARAILQNLLKVEESEEWMQGLSKSEIRAMQRQRAAVTRFPKFAKAPAHIRVEESCDNMKVNNAMANALIETLPDSQYHACLNKYAANLVVVQCGELSNYGQMLAGRVGMTVAHLVPNTTAELLVATDTGVYPARVLDLKIEEDICAFEIVDKTMTLFPDVTKCFVKQAEIDKVNTGALITPRVYKGEICLDAQHGLVGFDLAGEESRNHYNNHTKNFVTLSYPSDKSVSARGYCGLPYVATDISSGISLVLGIHCSASVIGRRIWGTVLTQERVRAYLKVEQSESSPITDVSVGSTTLTIPAVAAKAFTGLVKKEVFPENDRIETVATGTKLFIGHNNTHNYRKLPFPFEKTPEKIPAIGARISDEVKEKFPLNHKGLHDRGLAQLMKMSIREKCFRPELAEHLKIYYPSKLASFFQDENCVRALTTHEVLNGVKSGPLSKLHAMDMSKSVGFTMRKAFGKTRKLDLMAKTSDGEQWKFNHGSPEVDAFFEIVKHIQDHPDTSLVLPAVATLKDELLPTAKVCMQGKIRVFSNVDFIELFLTKKYVGCAVGQMQNHLFSGSTFTAGFDPLIDLDRLFSALDTHPNRLTFDYSGWDKTLPRAVQKFFLDAMENVFSEHYSSQDFKMAQWCLRKMLDRHEVYNGMLMKIQGSISSGIFWTNYLNSGANEVLIYAIIMIGVEKELGRYPTIEEVDENVVFFTHGDDVILSMSDFYAKMLDYFKFREILKQDFGMTITPGNKDAVPRAFEPDEDLTFLSRYKRRIRGRIFGALKKESIVQQLNYSRNLGDSDALVANFKQCLLEACVWDAAFFNKTADCIKRNVKSLSITGFIVYPQEAYQRELLVKAGLCQTSTLALGSKVIEEKQTKDTPDIKNFPDREQQSRNMTPYTITCEACKTSFSTLEEANKHRKDPRTLMTFTTPDAEAFRLDVLKRRTPFDLMSHQRQVQSHKKCVDKMGLALLGKTYPSHDLSKYSPEEAVGYTLRWVHFLNGPLWDEALAHHYKYNDHHAQSGDIMTDVCLQEAIVDGCACIWERSHPDKTPIEVLEIYRNEMATSTFGKPFGCQLPDLLAMCDTILARKQENPNSKIAGASYPCMIPRCGVKTITRKGLERHVINSHDVGSACAFCSGSFKQHEAVCPLMQDYLCPFCDYENEEERKTMHHVESAHPGEMISVKERRRDREQQSALRSLNTITTQVGEPNVIPTQSNAQSPLVAGTQGIPNAAPLMMGYARDIYDATRQMTYMQTLTIPHTLAAGTIIGDFAYADPASMNPAAAGLSTVHRNFYGSMSLRFTVYGASNITGSILIAVVPPEAPANPTIVDLMTYGGEREVACNAQTSFTLSMSHAGSQMTPAVIGARTDQAYPRIVAIVKEQLINKIGDGATTVNIQVHGCLGDDAGFAYFRPLQGATSTLVSSQDTVTKEVNLFELVAPGNYVSCRIDGRFRHRNKGRFISEISAMSGASCTTDVFTHAIDERRDDNLWQAGNWSMTLYDPDATDGESRTVNQLEMNTLIGTRRSNDLGLPTAYPFFWDNQYWARGTGRNTITDFGDIPDDYHATLIPVPSVFTAAADVFNQNVTSYTWTEGDSWVASVQCVGGGTLLHLRGTARGHNNAGGTPDVQPYDTRHTVSAQIGMSAVMDSIPWVVEALSVNTSQRLGILPPGCSRFTLSSLPPIFMNEAIRTKYPMMGISAPHEALVEKCIEIGRGSSLRFEVFDGSIFLIEVFFHFPSKEFWVRTPLDYAHIENDFTFRNFQVEPDSYIPAQTVQSSAWVDLSYVETGQAMHSALKLNSIRKARMQEGSIHFKHSDREAQSMAAAAAVGMGAAGMSGIFSGHQSRAKRNWIAEMAPKYLDGQRDFETGMVKLNGIIAAGQSILNNRLDISKAAHMKAIGNANMATIADSMGMGLPGSVTPSTDSVGRIVQTTPGGNDYVQDWNRQKSQKPTHFDAFTTTEGSAPGAIRVDPAKGIDPPIRPVNQPPVPKASLGTMTDEPVNPPTSPSGTMSELTQSTSIGSGSDDGSVFETEAMVHNASTGPELDYNAATNTDGNITMVDDDMIKGVPSVGQPPKTRDASTA